MRLPSALAAGRMPESLDKQVLWHDRFAQNDLDHTIDRHHEPQPAWIEQTISGGLMIMTFDVPSPASKVVTTLARHLSLGIPCQERTQT